MPEVIGVRFKSIGKIYSFDACGQKFDIGEKVIVETVNGVEIGEVALKNREMPETKINKPLKNIIRSATAEDLAQAKENEIRENEARRICETKIAEHSLEMNLVDVQYMFDRNKILFYFTAEGRVDFRELVKSLASVFKTRIELRQIGVRDEAKMLGGIGICGRVLCCGTFVGDFEPVSIKMAKEQSLSLNPTKISGSCGRLMCCLKYEQDAYEEMLKKVPKVGATVSTPKGKGVVIANQLLKGLVTVKVGSKEGEEKCVLNADQVKILKDVKVKLTKEELEALKGLEE